MRKVSYLTFLLVFLLSLSGCDALSGAETHTVSFRTNGGTTINDEIVEENSFVGEPTIPMRDGYEFLGWYSDSTLNNTFDFSTPISGDIVLHAMWIEEIYTITYYSDGVLFSEDSFFFNDLITEPIGFLYIPGYTFGGWFHDEMFSLEFTDDNMPSEDLTLYAKWEILTSNLIFHDVSGNVIHEELVAVGVDLLTFDYPDAPLVDGYEFDYWDGLTFTMPLTDLDMYAVYTPSVYNLTYNYNGEVYEEQYEYGEDLYLLEVDDLAEMTFSGWCLDVNCVVYFDLTTMPSEDITLYADYENSAYEINYSVNGEITYTEMYTIGTNFNLPVAQQIDGFVFMGWYADEGFNNEFRDYHVPSADLTLYAFYIEIYTSVTAIHDETYTYASVGFQGVISSIFNGGFFLSDGNYSIAVYTGSTNYDVYVGYEIAVYGTYSVFNTLYQISDLEYIGLISSSNTVNEPTTEISISDLLQLDSSNRLIHGKSYTISGTLEIQGSYDNIYVVDGEDKVLIYYNSPYYSLQYLNDHVGDIVEIEVIYYTDHATDGLIVIFSGSEEDILIVE